MLQSTQVGLPSAPVPVAGNRMVRRQFLVLDEGGGAVISPEVELVFQGVAGKLTEAYPVAATAINARMVIIEINFHTLAISHLRRLCFLRHRRELQFTAGTFSFPTRRAQEQRKKKQNMTQFHPP